MFNGVQEGNAFRGGEQYKFGQELDKKYGEGRLRSCTTYPRQPKSRGAWMREMIEVFKVECERINEEKDFDEWLTKSTHNL